MPHRSHRRRRARRPRRRKGGLGWRWLGLGALAVVAGALLRTERRTPRRPGSREPGGAERLDATPAESFFSEPPEDAESSWVPGPAGSLHVLERHPGGPLPVVFVHGLAGRAEHWSPQLHAAGPAIRAVAIDLPGHGRSDPAIGGDYGVPAMAAAVSAVVDALALRRTVLVAHSLGASAVIEYAGRHRDRVAGLLLVDPSGDQTRLPAAHREQLLAQLRRDPGDELRWYFKQLLTGARPEVADRVLEDLDDMPAEIVLRAIESSAAYSPLPALQRFGGPAVSLISDLNTLPYSLHSLVPSLPVQQISRASHWLMLDRPEDLWASLIDFLDRIGC